MRFKIPKTTVASSIRSVSTSIVVMRVPLYSRGITSPFHISSFIIAYMVSYCVNKPLFGAAFVYLPRISIT